MAVYTTFFAATPREVRDAFPGWFEPLAKPVKRTMTNPFTKQPLEYDSHAPDEAFAGSFAPTRSSVVVTGKGDYGAYLQSRLPGDIQALPNLPLKSVHSLYVEDLLRVIGTYDPNLLPGLIPPGGDRRGVSLDGLPEWSTNALAALGGSEIARAADTLLANADSWFAQDGWAHDDCSRVVGELSNLAKRAGARRLWLLTQA